LAQLALKVAAELPDWRIASATMAAKGTLERQLEQRPEAHLFPLFMADGWFTGTALPQRLIRQTTVLRPLGLDDGLPEMAAAVLRNEIGQRGWDVAQTDILVAGHGGLNSRNPAKATRRFAAGLQSLLPLRSVRAGFVEEAPKLDEVAADMGRYSLCLPFFAAKGLHVRRDIPALLQQGGFQGDLLDPVGLAAEIPALIARALRDAQRQEKAA
jgi:sirohydrochlorin ferrochelatase